VDAGPCLEKVDTAKKRVLCVLGNRDGRTGGVALPSKGEAVSIAVG
jgi:hypothetical protein